MLSGLRMIEHPFPLFLLGVDVLCVGQEALSWKYKGITLTTNSGIRTSSDSVRFKHDSEVEEMPFIQAAYL